MPANVSPAITRTVTRFWPLVSSGVAVALAVLLGVVVTLRLVLPDEVDDEWMEEIVENRNGILDPVAYALSWIGGGWFGVLVVPIGIALVLLLAGRRWAALYAIVTFVASAGVVQLLKLVFGRARPEEILVVADPGSFPSGHTANAATIGAVLFILTWRWWVLAAGIAWTVLMAFSRTYLGAHWLTDTIGGMLLGAAVAILVWAPFAEKLRAEHDRLGESSRGDTLRRASVAP